MSRMIVYVGSMCNLRCRLCQEYIPYLRKTSQYAPELIKKSLYEYFQLVNHVSMITLSGGEPLLMENTAILVEFLTQFKDRYDKLEIMTNGSLLPSECLMKACQNNEKSLLFINHYGVLSPRVEELGTLCEARGIKKQIRIYYGENAHCGGWFDLGLLSSERLPNDEALRDRFSHCQTGNNKKLGLSFGLFESKLYACSISGIAARLGVLDSKDVCLDLADDTMSYEQKRERLETLCRCDMVPACALCCGNDDRIVKKRYVPAEQMP